MTKSSRTAWIAPALAAGPLIRASIASLSRNSRFLSPSQVTVKISPATAAVNSTGPLLPPKPGAPVIEELAVRRKGSAWVTLAANAAPDFGWSPAYAALLTGNWRRSHEELRIAKGDYDPNGW